MTSCWVRLGPRRRGKRGHGRLGARPSDSRGRGCSHAAPATGHRAPSSVIRNWERQPRTLPEGLRREPCPQLEPRTRPREREGMRPVASPARLGDHRHGSRAASTRGPHIRKRIRSSLSVAAEHVRRIRSGHRIQASQLPERCGSTCHGPLANSPSIGGLTPTNAASLCLVPVVGNGTEGGLRCARRSTWSLYDSASSKRSVSLPPAAAITGFLLVSRVFPPWTLASGTSLGSQPAASRN